jgi:hypothetical protein
MQQAQGFKIVTGASGDAVGVAEDQDSGSLATDNIDICGGAIKTIAIDRAESVHGQGGAKSCCTLQKRILKDLSRKTSRIST